MLVQGLNDTLERLLVEHSSTGQGFIGFGVRRSQANMRFTGDPNHVLFASLTKKMLFKEMLSPFTTYARMPINRRFAGVPAHGRAGPTFHIAFTDVSRTEPFTG